MQGDHTTTTGPNVQDLAHFGAGLGGQGGVRGLPSNPLLPSPPHSPAAPAMTLIVSLAPAFLAADGA